MVTLPNVLDGCTLERVPPGLRFSLRQALEAIEAHGGVPGAGAVRELWRIFGAAEPWVGLEPSLAAIGHTLLDRSRHHQLRTYGCSWCTLFPTAETMARLAEVALSEDTPAQVRAQATWALGYRQARDQPLSVTWTAEAEAVADTALVELAKRATAAEKIPFEELPLALRHVQSEALFEVFAGAPMLWGEAYEAFGDPRLARTLLERIEALPNEHQRRAMRLAAAVLRDDGVELLLEKARAAVPDRLELLFLALTFGGEAVLPTFEQAIDGYVGAPMLRERARWHLEHPEVVPTVRGLQIARTTALLPGEERVRACARAADDFAALTAFGRHAERYLYTMWATMVRGSGDPARARTLTTALPEARENVTTLYLQDLAARGRAKQVIASAQQLEGVEAGALALARHGRPFLALELAATSRLNTPEVAAARVLGLWRAGRPDLARRVLAEELPPAEVVALDVMPTFPGVHEHWLAENHPSHQPAVTALIRGMDAVLGLGDAAPEDAEPDSYAFDVLGDLERWLARPIDGATVYLAGDFPGDSKTKFEAAILERGGRLVDGPFPGTHYYVMGLTCPVTIVAQLERQGTRRIRSEELGLPW